MDRNDESTMRNSMQSKYVAVLSGDPMLLHMVAPVVDQSGHLLLGESQKNCKVGETLTDICGMSLTSFLWTSDALEAEKMRRRKERE